MVVPRTMLARVVLAAMVVLGVSAAGAWPGSPVDLPARAAGAGLGDDFERGGLKQRWSRIVGSPRFTADAVQGRRGVVLARGSRPRYLEHRYPRPATAGTIAWSYRHSGTGRQEILSLVGAGLALSDDGRGRLLVTRAGRAGGAVMVRRRAWNRVVLSFDARRDRVRLAANGARGRWRATGPIGPARSVRFGAARLANGPILFDAVNRPIGRASAPSVPGPPSGAPAVGPPPPPPPGPWRTRVGVTGARWTLNGRLTYPGTSAEGTLQSARMSQGVFDDENPESARCWAYPDTGVWDPERNVRELIDQLATYAAHGLSAITVSLQGGTPSTGGPNCGGSPVVSAYTATGDLKPVWRSRAERVIEAADAQGIVVILTGYHFGQVFRVDNPAGIRAGVTNTATWLRERGYTNVLYELENESNSYRAPALIPLVRAAHAGLLVGTSATPGSPQMFPDDYFPAADFVMLHVNGRTDDEAAADVAYLHGKITTHRGSPMPIQVNEDSAFRLTQLRFDRLNALGVGNGYYDQTGFQNPAVDWSLNTADKRAYFAKVAALGPRG